MDKIYIFDVDGTLTPSRRKMTKEFKEFFEQWSKKNKFYLVTGSDLSKLQEQMDYMDIEAEKIFTCCGNEMWEPDPHTVNTGANLLYSNKFKPPENLLTYLGFQIKMSDSPVMSTNHREDRGSMLNFSVVGRDCTLEERQQYFEWDGEVGEREKIAKEIKRGWPQLDAVIGGQISIDIYPKGMDKSQILEHIQDDFEIPFGEQHQYIFIGDRTMKGGNDYPLAKLMDKTHDCTYYQTENPEQTQQILENLID
jgi:phosphomannomutase